MTDPSLLLCCDCLEMLESHPERVRVLDVETTGLNSEQDDILQVSIIDGAANVLMDEYLHPYNVITWPRAQRVNGISPQMVRDAPSMAEMRPRIDETLQGAELIIGYNLDFDVSFLKSKGVQIPQVDVCDVMLDFAAVYGEWLEWAEDYKWQKLTSCAHYYRFDYVAHNSLEDVKATLYCLCRIAKSQLDNPEYVARRVYRCRTIRESCSAWIVSISDLRE